MHLRREKLTKKFNFFSKFPSVTLKNENFIKVVDDKTVDLVTSFIYTPEICSINNFKTINRFSTDTMKWQNETFFPEKYGNLHGCPLRVESMPEERSNISQEIFKILAEHLNYQPFSENNFNITDNMNLRECLFFQHLDTYAEQQAEFSSALYDDFLTYMVPAGEPYTQIEKMFLMFDDATWIWIGVTFGVGITFVHVKSSAKFFVWPRNSNADPQLG
jgi:hypothetical protein